MARWAPAALSVAYGAGLRVSEVAALKVSDIDSQRMTLRVEQGKGQRDEPARLIEVLLRLVAVQPFFQQLQVSWVGVDVRQRDLVRAPEAFQVVSVHFARGRPALGASQNDHWPARPRRLAGPPRLILEFTDLQDAVFQGRGHRLVHALGFIALHKIRGVPVADEQRLQLLVADAGQQRGLVAVEVQHRQHRPVTDRVEELVAVPARGQGAGLGLAVAHHGQGDQVRVVVDRPVGVRDAVAQLAALVDAAGCLGRGVAADPARE